MDPLNEESEMSVTKVVGGWMVPVEQEEEPLQEGHPDWRPWSGGHASPLEAMWQWMTRQGVGGLKDPEAVRREQEEAAQKAEADRQRVAQQQAQAEKDRAAKAEADRRAAEAKQAAEVRAKEAADAEAAAVHEHEEPVSGIATLDPSVAAEKRGD